MSINNFQELLAHKGHKISVVTYSEDGKYVDNVAIECNRCNEVLMDFDNPLPKAPPNTPIRCPYCNGNHTTIYDAMTSCTMGSCEGMYACNECGSRFKVTMAVTKILKVRKAKVKS